MSKRERKDPAYIREQGKRELQQQKKRLVTFCMSKHDTSQGQTAQEWEVLGILSVLWDRMRFVSQYSTIEALQKQYIKQYNKVDFPPDSGFTEPRHIVGVTWAVMHITTHSKEVVAGYLEEDVFYVVFLDAEHLFWPSVLRNT